MPQRSEDPRTFTPTMNDILRRLREVERHHHPLQTFEVIEHTHQGGLTWQSKTSLGVESGVRFYWDRAGIVVFARADRSSGDGTSTATLDVIKNGASIFPSSPKPTVAASTYLGPECVPDDIGFVKGDYYQIEIEATGGGTGPLRVTIHFLNA